MANDDLDDIGLLTSEEDDSSSLDDILGGDLTDADDTEEGGLELDDSQANEIRQIFLITLPQYLDPVEQMLTQLFEGESFDGEVHTALETTLASISEAAERINITDIHQALEKMRELAALLDVDTCVSGSELEGKLQTELLTIKRISGGEAPDDVPDRPRARTIVEAIRGKVGIDKSALERLTAAGVVTVDQLKMARLDEIAAVTGLGMAVVKTLVDTLLADGDAGVPAPKQQALGQEDPLAVGVHPELQALLRERVTLEAELEDLRAQVSHRQSHLTELERRMEETSRQRHRLRQSLRNAEAEHADHLARRGKAQANQARAERKLGATEATLQELNARFSALREERDTILGGHRQVAEEMAALVGRVKRVLERAPLSIPERTFRRDDGTRSTESDVESLSGPERTRSKG
jgi:hypothetical protein